MTERLNLQIMSDPSPGRRRERRYVVWVGLLLVAGLITSGVVGVAWYLTPPPLPETLEAAEALVDSPRFQRLSAKEKQPYYDVIREQFGSLDPAERARLVEENESLREAMREGDAARMRQMLIMMTKMPPGMLESLKKSVVVNERPADEVAEGEAEGAGGKSQQEGLNDWATKSDSQSKQLIGEFMGLLGD